jgi:hypothetical protein
MEYLLLMLFAYLVPTMVATSRSHRQSLPIFVINVFLGWTLIGWVVALAWACSTDVDYWKQRSKSGL